jgi:hypothetical protein
LLPNPFINLAKGVITRGRRPLINLGEAVINLAEGVITVLYSCPF